MPELQPPVLRLGHGPLDVERGRDRTRLVSKTYSYTPADPNGTYTLCAYVYDNSASTVDASNSAKFQTTLPSASVSISTPASTTQDIGTTITVSGSTQIARNLYVFVSDSNSTCPSYNPQYYGWGTDLSTLNGDAIGPGSS